MPDYRLIHRRALRGEKVAALNDFERGVWLAYLLISDDYGVMPFAAVELQRASWLKHRSVHVVQRGFQKVADVGLLRTWTSQGQTYCYAPDWQEWQNVRHPRATIEPCPPPDEVVQCHPETQELFQAHPRNSAASLRDSSGNTSEEFPTLAGAGGRETLTLTQTQIASTKDPDRVRARGVQGSGAGGGTFPRDHLRCESPCGRVCMHERSFDELVRLKGGTREHGETYVRQWKRGIDAAWSETGPHANDPIGDDSFTFWRARWREDHPSTVTAQTPPSQRQFAPGTSTAELVAIARRQEAEEKAGRR